MVEFLRLLYIDLPDEEAGDDLLFSAPGGCADAGTDADLPPSPVPLCM